MRHRIPSKPALLTASALVTLCAGLVPAGASTFKPASDYVVGVSGGAEIGVVDESPQVYEGDRARLLLVNLPWERTLFLVDLQTMTAFAVRREDADFAKDGSVKTRERFAWSVPVTSDPLPGIGFSFPLGDARVEVHRKEATAPPKSASKVPEPGLTDEKETGKEARRSDPSTPAPPGSPAPEKPVPPGTPGTDPAVAPTGPDASGCVSLEIRPAAGVPGCTRFVYVKNSCEATVVALVQRTERLMSGTLPQSFTVPVPPGEQWLGCSWWSGAMAPAKHELLGATYLEPPQRHSRNGQGPPPKR